MKTITGIAILALSLSAWNQASAFSEFDKNLDWTVDEYESCVFEYSKGEYYCGAFKEASKEAMWVRYGNALPIVPNAFSKNGDGAIVLNGRYMKSEPVSESVPSDSGEFAESVKNVPGILPKAIRDELESKAASLPEERRVQYLESIHDRTVFLIWTKITGERKRLILLLREHVSRILKGYGHDVTVP